eukprot:497554-Rhodomonas_salina.1
MHPCTADTPALCRRQHNHAPLSASQQASVRRQHTSALLNTPHHRSLLSGPHNQCSAPQSVRKTSSEDCIMPPGTADTQLALWTPQHNHSPSASPFNMAVRQPAIARTQPGLGCAARSSALAEGLLLEVHLLPARAARRHASLHRLRARRNEGRSQFRDEGDRATRREEGERR